MDLSIIIPVYNTGQLLERCLNSVLNQITEFKYEIIVVNDGSTDNSVEIIKKFEAKFNNIIFINQQQNKSLAVARKTGIEHSKGEYIIHLDSDDWLTGGAIQKMITAIKYSQFDVVVYGYYQSNGEESVYNNQLANCKSKYSFENKIEIQHLFMGTCVNKIVRRSLLKGLVYGKVYMNTTEDLIYSFELFLRSQHIGVINDNFYVYFVNLGSLTNLVNPEKYISAQIVVYQQLFEIIKKYSPSEEELKNVNTYLYQYLLIEIHKSNIGKKYKIEKNNFETFLSVYNKVDPKNAPKLDRINCSFVNSFVEYIKQFGILRAVKHSIQFN